MSSTLAISLLVGGAGLSSGKVGAAPINEELINIEHSIKEDEVQPMVWAALGRAALVGGAFSVGKAVGKAVANAVLGESVTINGNYKYEDIIESFDN